MQEITVALESPRQPDVMALIEALDSFHEGLYPPEANHHLDIDALCAPDIRFMVARRQGEVLGIGALWLRKNEGFGEIKRMFVRAETRGLGLGHKLLASVEALARQHGIKWLLLETGSLNIGAMKLYERAGFVKRGPFAGYPDHPASVFMEKALTYYPLSEVDSMSDRVP